MRLSGGIEIERRSLRIGGGDEGARDGRPMHSRILTVCSGDWIIPGIFSLQPQHLQAKTASLNALHRLGPGAVSIVIPGEARPSDRFAAPAAQADNRQ